MNVWCNGRDCTFSIISGLRIAKAPGGACVEREEAGLPIDKCCSTVHLDILKFAMPKDIYNTACEADDTTGRPSGSRR